MAAPLSSAVRFIRSVDEFSQASRGLYPGRVMLSLRRHMGQFSGLTPDEAASFGDVIAKTSAAIEAALDPGRVYLASFNEGSEHIHAHLLMRHPDETEKGP